MNLGLLCCEQRLESTDDGAEHMVFCPDSQTTNSVTISPSVTLQRLTISMERRELRSTVSVLSKLGAQR